MTASDSGAHRYAYLNEDEIKSIYVQLLGPVPTDMKKVSGKTVKKSGTGKVGVKGELFAALLPVSGSGELSVGSEGLENVETTYEVRTELLLAQISKHLSSKRELFRDLRVAASECAARGKGVFIELDSEKFDLYGWTGSVDAINEDRALILTKNEGHPSNIKDEDFDFRQRFKFDMVASFDHWPSARTRGIGKTSHEAVLFRGCSGKDIPWGVFGLCRKITEEQFQIKPMALWWP